MKILAFADTDYILSESTDNLSLNQYTDLTLIWHEMLEY